MQARHLLLLVCLVGCAHTPPTLSSPQEQLPGGSIIVVPYVPRGCRNLKPVFAMLPFAAASTEGVLDHAYHTVSALKAEAVGLSATHLYMYPPAMTQAGLLFSGIGYRCAATSGDTGAAP